MRMRRFLPVLGLAVTVVAACGSTADPVQSGPDPSTPGPAGHTYVSTGVSTGVAGHQLVAGTQVTLTFDDDGNLSVQAGCNTLGTT
jgi:heat shock protein HslJ